MIIELQYLLAFAAMVLIGQAIFSESYLKIKSYIKTKDEKPTTGEYDNYTSGTWIELELFGPDAFLLLAYSQNRVQKILDDKFILYDKWSCEFLDQRILYSAWVQIVAQCQKAFGLLKEGEHDPKLKLTIDLCKVIIEHSDHLVRFDKLERVIWKRINQEIKAALRKQ